MIKDLRRKDDILMAELTEKVEAVQEGLASTQKSVVDFVATSTENTRELHASQQSLKELMMQLTFDVRELKGIIIGNEADKEGITPKIKTLWEKHQVSEANGDDKMWNEIVEFYKKNKDFPFEPYRFLHKIWILIVAFFSAVGYFVFRDIIKAIADVFAKA